MSHLKIIGHRGYGPTHSEGFDSPINQSFPENSIVAFEHALSQGADGIEMDVQLSYDGVPVVLHDRRLEEHVSTEAKRTVRPFEELSFEQLQTLNIGADETIPSLREVLEKCVRNRSGILVNLDVKGQNTVKPVLKVIQDLGLDGENDFVVSSYDWDLLRAFRKASETIKLVPAIKTAILFGEDKVQMPGYIPLTDQYQDPVKAILSDLNAELGLWALDCTFTDFLPELLDLASDLRLGLQISTGNDRVSVDELDYNKLQLLEKAGETHPDIPAVVCKVDEPDLVKQRLLDLQF